MEASSVEARQKIASWFGLNEVSLPACNQMTHSGMLLQQERLEQKQRKQQADRAAKDEAKR